MTIFSVLPPLRPSWESPLNLGVKERELWCLSALLRGQRSIAKVALDSLGGKATAVVLRDESPEMPSDLLVQGWTLTNRYYLNPGTVKIPVIRHGTDLSTFTSVWCATRPSDPASATPGVDYVPSSRKVEFGPGVTEQVSPQQPKHLKVKSLIVTSVFYFLLPSFPLSLPPFFSSLSLFFFFGGACKDDFLVKNICQFCIEPRFISYHKAAHKHLFLHFQGIQVPLLDSKVSLCAGAHRHTYIEKSKWKENEFV